MIIQLEQGTRPWHDWRNLGIGGSESAALFNESPYFTKRELWRSKKKLLPEWFTEQDEFIFSKGHEFEEKMRQEYHLHFGVKFEPVCVQHDELPFIRCSLDGKFENMIFEAKLVSKQVRAEIAATNTPPRHHWIQIQHQLLASNADICIYFAHDLAGEAVICEVHPDEFFQYELKEKLIAFDLSLKNNEEPPMTKDDCFFSEDEEAFKKLIELKRIKDELDSQAEEAEKNYKTQMLKIVEDAQHENVASMTLKVKIKKVEMTGQVNFTAIPEVRELKTEYLESFRKPGSSYTRAYFTKTKAQA